MNNENYLSSCSICVSSIQGLLSTCAVVFWTLCEGVNQRTSVVIRFVSDLIHNEGSCSANSIRRCASDGHVYIVSIMCLILRRRFRKYYSSSIGTLHSICSRYSIAVTLEHVPAVLPYISDTGVLAPERSVFRYRTLLVRFHFCTVR